MNNPWRSVQASPRSVRSKKRIYRFRLAVASTLVVCMIVGLGIGLYFGFSGEESASELFEKGELAFGQGNYQEATEYFKKGIEKDPDSWRGYNLLGMAYRFQYNESGSAAIRTKEIEAFTKAIELDPDNPVILVNLGVTLFDEGRVAEAADYLKKALEENPNHPDRARIEEMIRQAESGQ